MISGLWDISQAIGPATPVWPGDTIVRVEGGWTIGVDCPVNVARLTLSGHSGSHADAPLHYHSAGVAADALDIGRYLGPCRLIDVRSARGMVRPADIAPAMGHPPPRILLRTYARFPIDHWRSDFTALAPELPDYLADLGVVLIGIDSPSVDPETSKTLDAHHAIARRGLSILEGLVLDQPPAGDYELIALPLALVGMDASPVRAVLRALQP